MAAMFITRSALFPFSKCFPYAPSLSLKPSRVALASASNYSDWRNAAEGTRDSRPSWTYDSAETKRKSDEVEERAKETMSEGVDKEYIKDAREKTKDVAGSMADKTKEGTDRAAETAEYAKDKAKEYVYDTKDSAKEAAGTVADKTKEGAERTKEKTEEVVGSTGDTLKNVGEKARQTVQGAWETAKDTTQKIKETVVGKDDDDHDDRGGHKDVVNEDINEFKRRAGKGYGDSEGYY